MSVQEEVRKQGRPRARDARLIATRIFDVVVALVGLFVSALLMVVIVLAIRADSRGPIIFSQVRLGQGGRHFRLYKFRKFDVTERENGEPVTLVNDPRFTRVGALLARTKLDELPQLWNVLKGDMSIVGPRPETLDFADCFLGPCRKVLDYRPGIFGPNQVFFRNEGALYPAGCEPQKFYRDVLFPLKARVDLAYFPYRSAIVDVIWIIRGILAVASSGSRGQGPHWAEEVENWIRRSHGRRSA